MKTHSDPSLREILFSGLHNGAFRCQNKATVQRDAAERASPKQSAGNMGTTSSLIAERKYSATHLYRFIHPENSSANLSGKCDSSK